MRLLIRRLMTPTGAVWILSHAIMVLVGSLCLSAKSIHAAIGTGIAEGIGGSLIATGIAGASLFLYVVSTDSMRSRIEMFTKAGLSAVYPGRSVLIRDQYQSRLANAQKIDLIGYGLSSFRQDYVREFVAWSHRAQIRILLPDPNFPSIKHSLVDQRDREENHPVGRTRADVEAFEKEIFDLKGLNRANFQVRRVSCIPSVNILRIDDDIFWGPYLMHQQSRNTPTLLVARGGYLFSALEEHFQSLWNQSILPPDL
ncbi:hypothetical protein QY049_15745 [Bradyrhizobium sp. WYCCWR 13022]|uniref:hypothetical protein n=1 Tax=unclassified Bradyrhizobium TaxID=2631580 RepID=UPI00263A5B74|nr:hypothetical protein [Bradyrhizobium sp. WYCCWR 13022]MDN4984656.1 hypothetical protein [Bradyrhizobium sp. WYCCWR 13022]